MNFREWLSLTESATPASKTLLYPLGYGGIGLYPLQYYMPSNADALIYISQDERLFHNGDSKIAHIPGKPSFPPTQNPNNGDGPPHSIRHVKH